MGDKFVGLVRVSTKGQGESGLGLASGRDDIDRYVSSVGGELVTVLEEIGSAKYKAVIKRPVLQKAMALCRRHKAMLLVPKIDRLVRSTEIHNEIKMSGVVFRACDNPYADEMGMDVWVVFAAAERRAISARTKNALRMYTKERRVSDVQMVKLIIKHVPELTKEDIEASTDKKAMRVLVAKYGHKVPDEAIEPFRGKLGSKLVGCHLTDADRALGRATAGENRTRAAVQVYQDLVEDMKAWRSERKTLRWIADELNANGERTRNGARWTKVQVKRLLDRVKNAR